MRKRGALPRAGGWFGVEAHAPTGTCASNRRAPSRRPCRAARNAPATSGRRRSCPTSTWCCATARSGAATGSLTSRWIKRDGRLLPDPGRPAARRLFRSRRAASRTDRLPLLGVRWPRRCRRRHRLDQKAGRDHRPRTIGKGGLAVTSFRLLNDAPGVDPVAATLFDGLVKSTTNLETERVATNQLFGLETRLRRFRSGCTAR